MSTNNLKCKAVSIMLTILMIFSLIPASTIAAFAETTGSGHVVYMNGTAIGSDGAQFAYGDNVGFSLKVDGSSTGADFLLLDKATADASADLYVEDWFEFDNTTAPGQYYLGYYAQLRELEAFLTRDYRITINKAQLATPVVNWNGNVAEWQSVTSTASNSSHAVGSDAVAGYVFTLYKNGSAVKDYSGITVTGNSVDCSEVISGRNYGEYTFTVVAKVSDAKSNIYTDSAAATSGTNTHSETVPPTISSYTTSGKSQLKVEAQDTGSGIAAYAFSKATSAEAVATWETISATTEPVSYKATPSEGAGVYYAYVKDAFGNTTKSDEGINVTEIKYNNITKQSTYLTGDNTNFTLSESETRTGYVFTGWYSDAALKNKIETVSSGSAASTENIYAGWERAEFQVVISATGDTEKTYDAAETTLTAASDADVEVSYKWYKDGEFIAEGQTITVKNVADSGTYKVKGTTTVDDQAVTVESTAVEVNISKRNLTAIITDATINYGEAAPAFSYTFTGFAGEENAETANISGDVKCAYEAGNNAGNYTVDASEMTAPNYTVSGSGTLHVKALDASSYDAVLSQDSYVYVKDTEFKPVVTVKDGALVEGKDFTVEYEDNTAVTDEAKAVITFCGNYTGTKTLTFAITKGSFETAVSIADKDDWTYGDEAHAVSVTTNESEGEIEFYYRAKTEDDSAEWTNKQPTNAGTYEAKAVIAATDNYSEVTSAIETFTIAPKKITITIANTGETEWVYDGKFHSNTSYAITSGEMVGSDSISEVKVEGRIKNVGEIETQSEVILAASTKASNYNIKINEATLRVTEATMKAPKVSWDNLEPGKAGWVASVADTTGITYKVTLYRGETKVGSITTSETEADLTDMMKSDTVAQEAGQEYRFTVTAIAGEGCNYSSSEESEKSGNTYTMFINVAAGKGVASAVIGDDAASAVMIAGEAINISATEDTGYTLTEDIWHITETEGTSASQLSFDNANKASTVLRANSTFTKAGTVTVTAVATNDEPSVIAFYGTNSSDLSKVTISLEATDTKAIVAYAITTETDESKVEWVEVTETPDLNVSEVVTAEAAYYGWIKDSDGYAVMSEPLNVYAITFAGGKDSEGTAMSQIIKAEGTSITLPENTYTRNGYEFLQWKGDSGLYSDKGSYGADQSETLTAQWSNETTSYVVNTYMMNVDGTYPETPAAQTYTGVCGKTIKASDFTRATMAGMTFDAEESTQGEITLESGKTAVINLYYKRNTYTVSYTVTNPDTGIANVIASEDYYFGQAINPDIVPANPKVTGYNFGGWNYGIAGILPETMPSYDIKATANLNAKMLTYKVYYYEENLDGNGYSLNSALTEDKRAYHGTSVDVSVSEAPEDKGFAAYKVYAGYGTPSYELPAEAANTATLEMNESNSNPYVCYYYTRESYKLKMNVWKGTPNEPGSEIGFTREMTLKYGQEIPSDFTEYDKDTDRWTGGDLTGYKLAAYRDWSCGSKANLMPYSDVTVTREFINDREAAYDIEIYLEDENGNFNKNKTYTFYMNIGRTATVGGDDTYTKNYNKLGESIEYFNLWQFDEDNENNITRDVIADPDKPDTERTVLKVYFERKTTTTTINYYVATTDGTSVTTSKIATGKISGKWGRSFRYDPMAFFGAENDDSTMKDVTTTSGIDKDYFTDGYIVSVNGVRIWYWQSLGTPSLKLLTAASLEQKYTAIFGTDNVSSLGSSHIDVYYTKANINERLDVNLQYTHSTKYGLYGNTKPNQIKVEYNGVEYPVKVMNLCDVLENTRTDADAENYPGLLYTNEAATFEYGAVKDGFEQIQIGGITCYLNEEEGVVYYADPTNQWYLGNRYEVVGSASIPGYTEFQQFTNNYKQGLEVGGINYGDDARYRLVTPKTYTSRGVVTSTATINATILGNEYSDGYRVTAILDGTTKNTGYNYAAGQAIPKSDLKSIITGYEERAGYEIKWYTDSDYNNPLGDELLIKTSNNIVYGRYEKIDITNTQYIYYQLANPVGGKDYYTKDDLDASGVTSKKLADGSYEYYLDGVLIAKKSTIASKSFEEVYANYEEEIPSGFHFDTKNTDNTLVGYCEAEPLTMQAYIARDEFTLTQRPMDKREDNTTSSIHVYEETVTLPSLTKDGYKYIGWKLEKLDAETEQFVEWTPEDMKNGADGTVTFTMPMADVRATGLWEPVEFPVTIRHYFADSENNYNVSACETILKDIADGKSGTSKTIVFNGEETTGEVFYDGSDILGVQIEGRFYRAAIDKGRIIVDNADLMMITTEKTVMSDDEYVINEDDVTVTPYSFNFAIWKGFEGGSNLAIDGKYTAEYGMSLSYYYVPGSYDIETVIQSTDGKEVEAIPSGEGTYVYGAKATLGIELGEGYEFKGWYLADEEGKAIGDCITEDATYSERVLAPKKFVAMVGPIAPELPTVTIAGTDTYTYGYETKPSDALKAKIEMPADASDRTQITGYQWFEKVNGEWTSIDGAKSSSYAFPTGKDVGQSTFKCVVTVANIDNNRTATIESNELTVTVLPEDLEPAAESYVGIYDGKSHGIAVLVPEEIKNKCQIYYSVDKELQNREDLEGTSTENILFRDVELTAEETPVSHTVYYYIKSGDSNYNDVYGSATVTIKPKSISVSKGSKSYSKQYDGTNTLENIDIDSTFYTIKGILPEEEEDIKNNYVISCEGAEFNSENTDATYVTIHNLLLVNKDERNANYNYGFSSEDVVLPGTITPLPISVIWSAGEDGTEKDGVFYYSYDGSVKGPEVAIDKSGMSDEVKALIAKDEVTVEAQGKKANAGEYTATAEVVANENYTVSTEDASFVIEKAKITIKPAADKVTYDGKAHTLELAETSIGGFTVTADITEKYTDAGTYTITPSNATVYLGAKDVTQFVDVEYASAVLEIEKKSIEVQVASEAKIFDNTDSATLSASVDTGIAGESFELDGIKGKFADVNVGTKKAVIITNEGTAAPAEGTNKNNYILVYPESINTGVIKAKTVTATVTAEDKTYDGTTDATVKTATVDTGIAGQSLSITGVTVAFADKNAGQNKVVKVNSDNAVATGTDGTNADNYVIEYPTETTATITAKEIAVEGLEAVNRQYDATKVVAIKDGTGRLTGTISGDDVSLTMPATGTIANAKVGEGYAVTVQLGSLTGADKGNYVIKSVNDITVDITKRPITLNITTKTITYGDDEPDTFATTVASGSYANGESAATLGLIFDTDYDTTDEDNRGVGEYTVEGAAANNNYEVTVNEGILKVNKATLTVKAANKSMTYGDAAAPANESSISGWKYSDEAILADAVTTSYSYNATINASTKAGKYSITPEATPVLDNYKYSYVAGELAVVKKTLTLTGITGVDKTYDSTKKAELNFDNIELSGIKSGDDVTIDTAKFSGEFVSADAGEDVGIILSYRATDLTGADKDNYTIDVENSQKTTKADIAKALLAVTAKDKNPVYYNKPAENNGVEALGLKGQDTLASIGLQITYEYLEMDTDNEYNITSPVGEYRIVPSGVAETTNYRVIYANGTMTVVPNQFPAPAPTWDAENPGTIGWTAIADIGGVSVVSYTATLKDASGGTVAEAIGLTDTTYDFESAIRSHGAGAYTVTVKAVSADEETVKSSSGTSAKLYAANVKIVFAGIYASAGSEATIDSKASTLMIAGEKNIPIAASLVEEKDGVTTWTGYTLTASANSNVLSINGSQGDKAAKYAYSGTVSLAPTLASNRDITINITPIARPATIEATIGLKDGDSDHMIYGYEDGSTVVVNANAAAIDNIETADYIYSYTWYWKPDAKPYQLLEGEDGNSWKFKDDQNAYTNYQIKCVVTATRKDNGKVSAPVTLNQRLYVDKDNLKPDTTCIVMDGWQYGNARVVPSVTRCPIAQSEVAYSYQVKGTSAWIDGTPTDAGEYLVKAYIHESTNYTEFTTDAIEVTITQNQLAKPQNVAMNPSGDCVYGKVTWDKVSSIKENAGAKDSASEAKVTGYTATLYANDGDAWKQVGTPIETTGADATSADFTKYFTQAGTYQVRIVAHSSNTKNVLDSEYAELNIPFMIDGDISADKNGQTYTERDVKDVYDGQYINLTALFTGTGTYQWYVDGEEISGATSKTYSIKNVADSGRYTCVFTSAGQQYSVNTNVTITPAPLTVSLTGETRQYDGTKAAKVTGTVAPVTGESITITGLSGTFDKKDVGNNINITVNSSKKSETAGEGTILGNYVITYPETTTGNITKKDVNATVAAKNKTYDGNTAAKMTASVETGVGSETLAIVMKDGTFDDKNVGTGKIVTVNKDATISGANGADPNNYNVIFPDTTTANITVRHLTITGHTATDKIYDGNNHITITGAVLNNKITGDDVNVVLPTAGTTENANAGKNKPVEITKPEVTGTDAKNYVLDDLAEITVNISKAQGKVTITNDVSKVYDAAEVIDTTYDVVGDGSITVEYKKAGAADSTYSTDKPVNAGTYVVRVTKAEGTNYLAASDSKEFTISPRPVEITWNEPLTFKYDKTTKTVTGYVSNKQGNDSDDDFALAFNGNSGVAVKTYEASVTALGNSNYTLEGGKNITQKWNIEYIVAEKAILDGDMKKAENGHFRGTETDGWFTGEVTVEAPEGYLISTEEEGFTTSLKYYVEGETTVEYYLQEKETGAITDKMSVSFKIDSVAPKATITIGSDSWIGALIGKLFFYKNSNRVNISAAETTEKTQTVSGVDTIYYQKVAKGASYDVNGQWTEGTSFDGAAAEEFTVYAKVVDNAGNSAIINSDGIVVWQDAAKSTESVTYVRTTSDNVAAEVTLNSNTIKGISCAGEELVRGEDYTVAEDGKTITLMNSFLRTKAVGTYQIVVAYNPYGETYTGKGDGETIGTTQFTLEVVRQQSSVTITNDISKTYDTKAVKAPEYTKVGTGAITIEYKKADESDDAYTTTAPTDAGSYVVRVSQTQNSDYAASSDSKDFTISKAEPTLAAKGATVMYGDDEYQLDVTCKPGESTPTYKSSKTDIATVSADGKVTNVNAGETTITISMAESDNYLAAETTVTVTVMPRPVELKWGKDHFIYTQEDHTITATVNNKVNDSDEIKLTYEDNVKADIGEYTAKVTAVDNKNYTVGSVTIGGTTYTAKNLTHDWDIVYPVVDAEAYPSGDKIIADSDWYVANTKANAPEGYLMSVDGGETWVQSVDVTTEGQNDIKYILKDEEGRVSKEKTITIFYDSVDAEFGRIQQTLGARDGKFILDATDETSGVDKYGIAELPEGLEAEVDGNVVQISGAEPATTYVITVTVTDVAGHETTKEIEFTTAMDDPEPYDNDGVLYRVVIFEGVQDITDELAAAGFGDESSIFDAMARSIMAKAKGFTKSNMKLYDVQLQFSEDDGATWDIVEPEDFPAEGVTATIPYPAGSDKVYAVNHMFAKGDRAGSIEFPSFTKGSGLTISFKSLSPVMVAWKNPDKGVNTADDSNLLVWLLMLLGSSAGTVATVRRRKTY